MLFLVHLIYMAGDKCMRQNACFSCILPSNYTLKFFKGRPVYLKFEYKINDVVDILSF